jgi:hypothetical protein
MDICQTCNREFDDEMAAWHREWLAVRDLETACVLSASSIRNDGWNPLVGVGLDDETLPFAANLARLNDFGLCTYVSQPSGPQSFRGRSWVQRAYVLGCASPDTVSDLRAVAAISDFKVYTERPNIPVFSGDRNDIVPWAYGSLAARDEGYLALAEVLDSSINVWLLAAKGSDSVFTAF